MNKSEKEQLGFERLIFFSDAVVAIAITLLALDLAVDVPDDQVLTFHDLIGPWKKYVAFLLSFINIAGYWRTHHEVFTMIRKIDEKMMFFNFCWLFLIILIPFTTSLISIHFTDAPAIFLYCLNIFLLAGAQFTMWMYSASNKNNFVDSSIVSTENLRRFRIMLGLDMFNGLIAIVVSFFIPVVAFFLLFFKVPIYIFGWFYLKMKNRKGKNSKTQV